MASMVWTIWKQQYYPRTFWEQHGLSLSTFFAKRRQLQIANQSEPIGFVRDEIVEKTIKYQVQIATVNMTLLINDVELSILKAPEIYLYRESVDFRKSINGLAAIIESDTDLDRKSVV